MKSMLRWPLRGAALGLLAICASGCYIQAETATRFEGAKSTQTGAYVAGKSIRVESDNGQVKLVPGGSSTELSATFQPYSMRPDSEEQQAKDDMKNDLVLTVDDTGDPIVVGVSVKNGANGGLGADVNLALPAGFDGGIDLQPRLGSVEADLTGGTPAYTTVNVPVGSGEVWGAGGPLSIDIFNATDGISVQSWSQEAGHVTVGNGDIAFSVAPGLSGNILATAGTDSDTTITAPANWTETPTAHNEKTYNFGPDAATLGTVAVTAEFTFGDIAFTQD
jgi:hypothetical protein